MSKATSQPSSYKTENVIKPHKPFPIVGIGASAGGIEAITTLLENLAPNNGMAYVIVQHLSANHESILPEIFERKTKMPVHRVVSGMEVMADNVYVIPPDAYMSIADGHLTLSPRGKATAFYHPIDHFLIALAAVYQNLAIGVILSGTATDGTAGLKAIKVEGGITYAQDDSAKFKSMPHSANESGQVDFVLSPEKIAKELAVIGKLPYVSNTAEESDKQNEGELRNIFTILYNKRDVDFSMYKKSTIYRRILRRAALHRLKKIEDYTDMLRADDGEVGQLYNDLLINVTGFFRDPAIFTALGKKILPALTKKRKAGETIRIWVPACSSGEEAYSIAICMNEFLASKSLNIPFQVFATDINDLAVERARNGIYIKGALQNLSPSRLKNYFVKIDGSFQVIKALRDVCVFAPHNLLTDPPFSRIDVISCQNVMIYLEPASQNKILHAFHYALKDSGYLMLGKSESIGEAADVFNQEDRLLKLYTKKEGVAHRPFNFSMRSNKPFAMGGKEHTNEMSAAAGETDVEKETDKILLSRYVPASVLVNKDLQIIRFNGPISEYMQPASGKATLSLLKMVKEEFLFDLRNIISRVKKTGQPVKKEGIQFGSNGSLNQVALEVMPVTSPGKEPYYLILFKDEKYKINVEAGKASVSNKDRQVNDGRIIKLETELSDARRQMKSVSEEFEAAREELQSSNEEVLSSNEELQSMNEELETSKEELQSTNEELTTINEELNYRNHELKEAFEYREAIVETIREPLVVLNADMRVITANKAFYYNFKLTPNDTEGIFFQEIGIGQWNIPSLKKQLNEIVTKNKSFENFEITHAFSEEGQRTILFNAIRMGEKDLKKNKILLVIEDITEKRKAEEELKKSHEQNLRILNSITDIFIAVDNSWKYTFINKSAEQFIGKKAKEVLGKNIWEVLPAYAGTEFYIQLIQAMKTKQLSQFEFFDQSSKRWYNYRLYPAKDALTIYASDITEQKLSVDLVNQSRERYQTFLSKNTEGIWRFEVEKPISTKFSKDVQVKQLLKSAFLAECNDSIAKMYGYTKAEDIVGNSMEEMLSATEGKNYLLQFVSANYFLNDVEVKETGKDGAERYFLNNLVGIVENGAIKRIWGTQRDITQQKKAEIDLKNTQQRLSLALSVGSVATWIWNINTDRIEWPPEQQSLYGLQECPDGCTYEDWLKLIHAEDVIEVQKLVKKSLAEKKDLNVEFRVTWPDDSLHYLLFKANPSYDEKGKAIQLAGVNIDITDRKMLEKEREDFIVIASHELKTPVTSIKAYAEVLNEVLLANDDVKNAAMAKRMDVQIDRLNNLIKDLLDVTKINEGQFQLKLAAFDFNEIADEVIEDMQNTTSRHTLVKEADVARAVWGDKNKIREVLINLISNAIKYSPDADKIIVSATTSNGHLLATVKDFGIGLTKKNQEKIFERFFRVNDSTVNTYPGLGLGLYICSEIIKRHSGTISVASVKDKGSEFSFTLPLAAN